MNIFTDPAVLVSFLTLVLMEIVLGVDNIIFISILTSKLPKQKQPSTRMIGLTLALGIRILLLLGISWIAGLVEPLFEIAGHPFSGRDLILLTGGLFLIVKTAIELIHKLKSASEKAPKTPNKVSVAGIIVQILIVDIIFSFDSILTAVGLVSDVQIMIGAVFVSMIFMMFASGFIGDFIVKYPSIKFIALAFLILIGAYLFLEGLHIDILKKEYLYFSLVFALLCEWMNIYYRKAIRHKE